MKTRGPKLTEAERADVERSLARTGGANGAPSKNATTIDHHRVVEVAHLVDASGAVELNSQYRAEDKKREGTRPGGPKSKVNVRQMLILATVLALDGKPATAKAMARLLMFGLGPKSLKLIGLDPSTGNVNQWADRINTTRDRHWLKPVDVERLDPSVGGDRRRRQVRRDYEAMKARLDPDLEAEKRARLNTVMNLLLDPTIDMVPKYLLDGWDGHTGIDATTINYDVNHGNRMRDISPDDLMAVMPNGNYSKGTLNFGADLHLVIAMPNTPYANDEFPRIATAMSFDRCSTNPGQVGLRAYQSLQERRYPVKPKKRRFASVDGGYFPNPKPENFQNPMWHLGIDLVGTYGEDFVGVHGTHKGLLFAEGDGFCPYTPKSLLDAGLDRYKKKVIDSDTFYARIEERKHYEARVHETRPNGNERRTCPAKCAGGVNCSLVPDGNNDPNLPTVNPGPATEVCGRTVTVPVEIIGKYRQGLPWKFPEHQARFKSPRSTNESVHGVATTDPGLALKARAHRRVRSMAGQFFACTLIIIASNVHRIDTHVRAIRDGTVRPPHVPRTNRWGIDDGDDPDSRSPTGDQNPNAPPLAA